MAFDKRAVVGFIDVAGIASIVLSIGPTPCFSAKALGLDGLAVGIFEVVGECEALGPVGALAVADLEHPRSVGLVAAIQQKDAARQRRAAVGPAADGELVSRALRLSIALKLTLRAMKFVPRSREVSRSCL